MEPTGVNAENMNPSPASKGSRMLEEALLKLSEFNKLVQDNPNLASAVSEKFSDNGFIKKFTTLLEIAKSNIENVQIAVTNLSPLNGRQGYNLQ